MVVDTPLGLAVPLLDWEKRAGPWRLQQAYHSFLHPFVKLRLQLNLLLGMHQPQLLLDWHGPWLELDCCAVPVWHHPYLLLLVCEDICIIFDQLPDCLLVPWLFQVVTLA